MTVELDSKDIINSINQILSGFITNQQDEDDELNVYTSFDYNEIKMAFENGFGGMTPKPMVHLWENPINGAGKTLLSTKEKGEKLYCSYTIFIVIDNNLENPTPRKFVLNRLMSELKYKFDNYSHELPFKNIKINVSSGTMGQNADNLYASQQSLTFEVYKELR